jgi:valyl-tRNA synthetase
LLRERKDGDDIIISMWPSVSEVDKDCLTSFERVQEVVSNIRNIRKEKSIASKVKIELKVKSSDAQEGSSFDSVIVKLGNLSSLEYTTEPIKQANTFVIGTTVYSIPFDSSVDLVAEKKKYEEELVYLRTFLKSVQAKLSNERFMSGAPDQVVALERKKEQDTLGKISVLEEKIAEI